MGLVSHHAVACKLVVPATLWKPQQRYLAWVWFEGLYLNNLEFAVTEREYRYHQLKVGLVLHQFYVSEVALLALYSHVL